VLVVAGLLLCSVLLVPVRMDHSGFTVASSGPSVAAAPTRNDHAYHRIMQAPLAFDGLVSFAEPRWATLAERDPRTAREELVRRIAQMRDRVPLSPVARQGVSQWPSFTMASTGDPEEQRDRNLLLVFARAADFDERRAAQIAKRAPRTLFLAAEQLSMLEWTSDEDRRAGHRLHQLLLEATGCEDIELADADDVGLEVARRQNKPVGVLWQWFLNEFAHTERAWRFYRRSFPR
jgi:hypothetical protein